MAQTAERLLVSSESNPLRLGAEGCRDAEPCVLVIFGGTGDLAHRKLLPAIYALAAENYLPPNFGICGVAMSENDRASYASELEQSIREFSRLKPVDEDLLRRLSEGVDYVHGMFDEKDTYQQLAEALRRMDEKRGTRGNRLFYLAVPPQFFAPIVQQLRTQGLIERTGRGSPWTRAIIEKPFGRDLESAMSLNSDIRSALEEDQILRIDHYLGKETVQNLLVFRFANGIFEPLWNRRYVDHIQITVAESLGIEGRGKYYHSAGALRDMVQNHMLQVLALVGMEPPISMAPDAVRDEKVKLLRAVRQIAPEDAHLFSARGQYSRGWVSGAEVCGYREEPDIPPDSETETFVALKLLVDNWRWAGVPFYLRTGKRLPKRVTEVVVQFKAAPLLLFRGIQSEMTANELTIRIQPSEGISLRMSAKTPGQRVRIQPVRMDFQYGLSFGKEPPEAYERLLLDAFLGDHTLFTRGDEVEAAWSIVSPFLEGWRQSAPLNPNYEAGTWGPQAADEFLARDGRTWHRP